MIKELILVQWAGYSGGSVGEMLAEWEKAGIFTYVLPFLIIFALIFAVLSKMEMFKNRGVNAIISLAVALMSLQFDFVPRFFSEVFPRLGVGLSVILVILILVGLFIPEGKEGNMVKWILGGVGLVVAIVVLLNSGVAVGFETGYWFEEHWGDSLLIIVVVAAFMWIVLSAGRSKDKEIKVPLSH